MLLDYFDSGSASMNQLLPFAVAAPLMALMVVSRIRRNVGRQRVRPRRMQIRAALLSFALLSLALAPPFQPQLAVAMLAGIGPGIALAFLGLRHTRFETTEAGRFYHPNLYIGLAVSALFIARIAYRLIVLAPMLQSIGHEGANMQAMMFSSSRTPLTLAVLGLVVAYYVAYYIGVLIRSRALAPASPPPVEAQA